MIIRKKFVLMALCLVCQTAMAESAVISKSSLVAEGSPGEGALDNFNPVVTATSPISGSEDIDTNTKEIRVTFSQEMMTDRMWSVVNLDGVRFPEVVGQVRYANDNKTFVIPVKLQKDTVYALGFNSEKHQGFKSKFGKVAESYTLVFKTKG